MGNALEYVSSWILQNPSWTDLIIGAGILLQGELTILLSVYLVINKSITWTQFITIAFLTLVIGESVVYFFGRILRNTRFGWKYYKKIKANKKIQSYTYYLKTNMGKLLIFAKFLPATNFVILGLIGWSKTKFGKFFKAHITSAIIWFTSMTVVAYFLMSGLHYLKSAKIFREVEIGIILTFIIIFFGEQILRKMFKKYATLEEKAELIGEIIEEQTESGQKQETQKPSETETKE